MENLPCLWIRMFNIVKMSILHIVIYKFNIIPIKFPIIFADIEKSILKLYGNSRDPT